MIGTVIIIGFIIYLVYFYYNKKSIENFEIIAGSRSEEKLTQLTQNTEKTSDIILVSKYKDTYHNIANGMTKYIYNGIIESLLNIDSSKSAGSDENLKIFANINTLKLANDNILTISKYLDENY